MSLRCDPSTPVTVLRSVAHGPLGIVRSLGRLGVPVYVVDPDPHTPAAASRYCAGLFRHDLDALSPSAAVAALEHVAHTIGRRSVLIPTTDDAALFADAHADALRDAFLLPARRPGLAAALSDKASMHALAARCGIPTPRAVFPRSRDDVVAFLAGGPPFPVMLKGIDGLRLQRRAGARMVLVRDPEELLARYDALEDPAHPNLMLQEYVPGGEDSVWMFNGYFDARSECRLGFTGRKLRQHPPYTGATSLGVCAENDEVTALTHAFMRGVGYQGILDIGFRYDARDGRYKVLDVNPRIGATFRLFVADNGMDVARALYLDLTGQPVPSGTATEGRRWMVEDHDLVSSLRYRRDGRLTVREWWRSLRGVDEAAYLARDDRAPVMAMCRSDARKLVGQLRRARAGRGGPLAHPSPGRAVAVKAPGR